MPLFAAFSALFTLFLVGIVGIVFYKTFIKKKRVSNYYTPFDYISGQTSSPYHEEKEEQVEGDAKAGDK